jgi:hypothetical protein
MILNSSQSKSSTTFEACLSAMDFWPDPSDIDTRRYTNRDSFGRELVSRLQLLLLAYATTGCSEYEFKTDQEHPSHPDELTDTQVIVDTGDSAPPVTEQCNGIDDDADGLVDEGFPDTDSDGIADCVDTEECDGLDNDGDGEVDEDFDADGDGTADCLEEEYTVQIILTADDAWMGYVDGTYLGEQSGWNQVDSYALVLDQGEHIIAIHAWDVGAAIAGFLAQVNVDGIPVAHTGDGSWKITSGSEPTDWAQVDFDDSGWSSTQPCGDTSPWGTEPSELLDTGAVWSWYDTDCRSSSSLSDAWIRLVLQL